MSLFSVSLYAGIAGGPYLGESLLHARGFDAVWLAACALAATSFAITMLVNETAERGPSARIRLRTLVHPAGVLPGIVMFTSVFGFAGFMAFMPLYSDEIGVSARSVLLMYGSILVAIRLLGARLPDILGAARAGTIGLGLSAVGLAIAGAHPGSAKTSLFTGAAVFGVGQALSFPAFMALAAGRAPAAERGAAVGTLTAFIDLGFALGPVTLGVVAAASGNASTFLGGATVAILGSILHRALPARSTQPAG